MSERPLNPLEGKLHDLDRQISDLAAQVDYLRGAVYRLENEVGYKADRFHDHPEYGRFQTRG